MTYRPFIHQDYKRFRRRPSRVRRHARWLAPLGLGVVIAGAWLAWPEQSAGARQTDDQQTTVALAVPEMNTVAAAVEIPKASKEVRMQPNDAVPVATSTGARNQLFADLSEDQSKRVEPKSLQQWQWATVKGGDTLASIFAHFGLGPTTVHNVVYTNEVTANLRDLRPGQKLGFDLNADGELMALQFELDEVRLVNVIREEDDFISKIIERPLNIRVARVQGEIEHSLYAAGLAAGMSDALILRLAHIYAWDIDFVYDIRKGDRFYFIYEKVYRDGEYLRDGNILAATFVNRGEPIRAIRYETSEGFVDYFTPEGRNMRKEFLRTPVDFRRISSRFNLNRMHPTLGYRRPHEGVDYAADSGTPVIATGDGRVTRASRWGGYGNCIIIKHAGSFETLYAHLSAYANGVHEGGRVEQGEIIGYVGMTGTATGPHLHYEFHVNGQVRDPLKVKFPPAPPLPDTEMARFKQHAQPLLAKLDTMDGASTMVAAKQAP